MTGGELHHASVDAGERWLLTDAGGQLLQAWDSRGFAVTATYDALRRPADRVLVDRQRWQPTQPPSRSSTAKASSTHEGQQSARRRLPAQRRRRTGHHPAARLQGQHRLGVIAQLLPTTSRRRLATTRPRPGEVLTTSHHVRRAQPRADAQPPPTTASPLRRSTSGACSPRVTRQPPGAGDRPPRSSSAVAYDARANARPSSTATARAPAYTYDPDTFRLIELKTTRPAAADPLQDLSYTYDPVGNITRPGRRRPADELLQQPAGTRPTADYTYDPIYRLIGATGREHIVNSIAGAAGLERLGDGEPAAPQRPPGDRQLHRDLHLRPRRKLPVDRPHGRTSGRLDAHLRLQPTAAEQPARPRPPSAAPPSRYSYDAHGNIISMPHLSLDRVGLERPAPSHRQPDRQRRHSADHLLPLRRRAASASSRPRPARPGPSLNQRIYLGAYEVYREYDAAGRSRSSATPPCPRRRYPHLPGRDDHARRCTGHGDPAPAATPSTRSATSSATTSARP